MNATKGTAPLPEPDGHVLAMDNIPLALPVASVGSRALALALDYILVGTLGFLWMFAAFRAGEPPCRAGASAGSWACSCSASSCSSSGTSRGSRR
jgi:hypothetical protein